MLCTSRLVSVSRLRGRLSTARQRFDAGSAEASAAPADTACTLDEVRSFIDQHNGGRGVKLPGRSAEDIGTIHEAYNRSTYKYAEHILALLKRWSQNPG
ncbi:MAG TPA: hypothetical protein VMC79_03815 [Rectinemataceae bacterium]|nr:hypothetical protein [Rectinemataceae bacterium]